MASLKEIRTRITSVSSTRQITSAMKMVAAAKLKKAQDTILMMRPYANKLQEILSTLSSDNEGNDDNPYARVRNLESVLIVAVTSNRGSCGAFNMNVIKRALLVANEKYGHLMSEGKVYFMPIGKKAHDFFVKKNYRIIEGNFNALVDHPNFDITIPAAQMLMDKFNDGSYDNIEIVYNQFKNAAVQIVTEEQFLPIPKLEKKKSDARIKPVQYDFIFEPSKEFIIQELIPKSLKIQLYKALIDSVASEHGARMTAMHKATDNATEIIKEYKLQYNKARQAAITKEILEIVSGAEALRG